VTIVEAFRDDSGSTRQRVIAALGRLERMRGGAADALIRGLPRMMVFKRLCDPSSQLGELPRLEGARVRRAQGRRHRAAV